MKNNKIFSLIAIGFFLNVIVISLIANCCNCFSDNFNNLSHLTHINSEHPVINISGF